MLLKFVKLYKKLIAKIKKYPHLVDIEASTKLKKNFGQMKNIQCKGILFFDFMVEFEVKFWVI